MWIFLNNAFFSIVRHGTKPGDLLVRARLEGDIERVFCVAGEHTPHADYAYRAVVSRDAVAEALSGEIREINYSNFKNSVKEADRHGAYMDVWTVMRDLQERRARSKRRQSR